MKHQIQSRYPAPRDVVLKMFSDLQFHTRKLEEMKTAYKVLSHAADAQRFSIRVERKVPVQLPGVGKGAEATVSHEEVWDLGSGVGLISVETGGMPLTVKATATLSPDKDGTLITYEWDVSSRVPLVGGQIEKMAVADIDRRSVDETRISISLLDAYR